MNAKIILASGLLLSATAPLRVQAQASPTNQNVILYIGDGFGLAPKTAARMALGQGSDGKRYTNDANFRVLNLDNLKYNATVTTHSLNSWITDSAPGASVYACGKKGKQDNEVLALDAATGTPIETILEAAKKQGYAVGIVTTTRITHATPAAFASHIWYRDLEDYIAAQYIASNQAQYQAIFNASPTASFRYTAARDWELPAPKVGVEVDVLLGGGSRHFLPKNVASPYEAIVDAAGNPVLDPATSTAVKLPRGRRADDVDLVKYAVEQRNYKFVNSRDALNSLDISQFGPGGKKLLGLFNASHASYEQDRQLSAPWEPSLAEMTQMAIKVLTAKSNGKGFFLMVESGRIDHLEHSNTGGISVVAGTGTGTTNPNQYTIDADRPVYAGTGDAGTSATPTTARRTDVYGSDYMIKEVMAFDYAVAEGRALLASAANGKTLLFSTSDHECGGFAVTGLHDEADFNKNGTKIRTYSGQITKSVAAEAGYATPTNLARSDGGTGGFFPQYVLKTFQGKQYPEPASATARRIVVAYGSNPLTNGNGANQTGAVGNHTPQDVWVGADDNTGTHAVQISGRGLLDNTALTPIMADFLKLSTFATGLGVRGGSPATTTSNLQLAPVPFDDQFRVSFDVLSPATVSVVLYDELGRKAVTIVNEQVYAKGTHRVSVDGSRLAAGLYQATVTINGQVASRKTIKR